jgi:hypothetical protein
MASSYACNGFRLHSNYRQALYRAASASGFHAIRA